METALPTMRVPEMNALLSFQVFGARPTALPGDLAYTDRANVFTVVPQQVTVAGKTLQISSTTTITTSDTELVLEQTGDSLGATRLRLRSRSGMTGALFEQGSSLELIDFGFATQTLQRNIRLENRGSTNNYAGTPEWQFGPASSPSFVAADDRAAFVHQQSGQPVIAEWRNNTSTVVGRLVADARATWSTATDATRKGRLSFSVYDTAAREALRLDTDGSVATVTLLGCPSAPWGVGTPSNVRLGALSGRDAATGDNNLALGASSMQSVTSGGSNVGVGSSSMATVTSGSGNVGVGDAGATLTTGSQNTLLGGGATVAASGTSGGIALGANAGCASNEFAVSPLVNVVTLYGVSSTLANRARTDFTLSWVDSTDASRKARIVFNAWDTAAREYMRAEGSGSAPLIGFLGATAVARQNVTGVRTGTLAQLQTVVANLLAALANLGLITDSTT